MKPIILYISEITDSRELLEAKPSPAIPVFIYLILSLIIVTTTWSYFGEIDEYVKANGIVRPNDKIGALRNMIAGKIDSVLFEEGQQVKEGDILYVIEHENLILEEAALKAELDRYSTELNSLIKLKKSIADGKSYFDMNNEAEKEYYERYQKYLTDVKVNKEGALTDLLRSVNNTELNISSLNERKQHTLKELEKLNTLKQSVLEGSNAFVDISDPYYGKYIEYTLNIKKHEDIIKERSDKYDIISRLLEAGKTQSAASVDVDKTVQTLNNLYLLKQSITQAKNLFTDTGNPYYNQFNDYKLSTKRLEDNITQKEKALESSKRLYKVGSISKKELENAELQLSSAKAELEKFRNDYWLSINEKINQASGTANDLENAKLMIESAELDLSRYKNDYWHQLNQKLADNSKLIGELEISLSGGSKEISLYDSMRSNINTSIKKYKLDNLVQLNDMIDNIDKHVEKLTQQLEEVRLSIGNCIVKAQIAGTISVMQDINRGDLLQSGVEVASIVPDNNGEYRVQLFVSNKDIASLKLGQEIKYHFLALPYREYGEITGHITKIGTDARLEREKGISYYPVEATVENKPVYSYKGVKAEIKVGMACEAQVITKSKKILYWLLEKVNLRD